MSVGQNLSRVALLSASLGLASCGFVPGQKSKNTVDASAASAPSQALNAELEDGSQSLIIQSLLSRRSVLGGGAYKQIADAVMAANTRVAESELRAAKLRSEAASLNWLPTIGPSLSLTSLSDVATQILVEQVIFDGGGKKAERDFAQHDVEVAAVALSENSNTRVEDALNLYLTAQSHKAQAQVIEQVLGKLERYEYVMRERVSGGVSSHVDLSLIEQKAALLRAEYADNQQNSAMAMAELNAMSAVPLDGISGGGQLAMADFAVESLPVLRAQAEADRAASGAIAQRAGYLPGISLGGDALGGGNVALSVAPANGIGFGTGASLDAIDAASEAVAAQVNQVREETNREQAAMRTRLQALEAQRAQKQSTAEQAARNFTLFEAQWQEGTRSLPELVGQLQTMVQAQQDAATAEYEIARVQVKLAALMGVLVDGDKV